MPGFWAVACQGFGAWRAVAVLLNNPAVRLGAGVGMGRCGLQRRGVPAARTHINLLTYYPPPKRKTPHVFPCIFLTQHHKHVVPMLNATRDADHAYLARHAPRHHRLQPGHARAHGAKPRGGQSISQHKGFRYPRGYSQLPYFALLCSRVNFPKLCCPHPVLDSSTRVLENTGGHSLYALRCLELGPQRMALTCVSVSYMIRNNFIFSLVSFPTDWASPERPRHAAGNDADRVQPGGWPYGCVAWVCQGDRYWRG